MRSDRQRLGAVATALMASETRTAILARRLAGAFRVASSFASLAGAPEWLQSGSEARRQLGHRAALAGLGNVLAGSIDGRWLGGLAAVAGDAALDWATARNDAALLPSFDGPALDDISAALLRAAVPADLADFAMPAGRGAVVDPAVAERLVGAAA